jgi:hypothetical protein
LIEGNPDDVFADWFAPFFLHEFSQPRRRRPAIAMVPDKSGRLIEAVSLVLI